ncbi:hypothetical protein [Williamsia sp.]|uniref:hypothetical protein n=1 Tax=Williamsia sp. TaxID=1872085 RepID=UPI001A235619|nr:hypothetical protein [Williamsia sp.]MBJ7290392.1 hypothetical protein [Williamsia sp.]
MLVIPDVVIDTPSHAGLRDSGVVMQWWTWLIIVVVVIAVIVGAVLAIQARRRSGGVIISDSFGDTTPRDKSA